MKGLCLKPYPKEGDDFIFKGVGAARPLATEMLLPGWKARRVGRCGTKLYWAAAGDSGGGGRGRSVRPSFQGRLVHVLLSPCPKAFCCSLGESEPGAPPLAAAAAAAAA